MLKVTLTPVVSNHSGLHLRKPFLLLGAVCPPSVHMWFGLLSHREHLVKVLLERFERYFTFVESLWSLSNTELSGGSWRGSGRGAGQPEGKVSVC